MTQENHALPQIAVNAQYIKDLSFENPLAPNSLATEKKTPKVDLSLDVGVAKLPEEDLFEVTIHIHSKASIEDNTLFIVELIYGGVFHLINVTDEQRDPLLAIHCPAMLFPFARKIVADVTQDGGFQPLMIDPIDFGMLYHKKLSESQN